jgi:hypothetical protein
LADGAHERCQFENTVFRYAWPFGMLRAGRDALRRLRARTSPLGCGTASGFVPGDIVRVRDRGAVRATLDARGTLRGLRFTDEQWVACGRTYRVATVVRRMMDDERRMRRISRTVTLDGPDCGGPDGTRGCGRACPLHFRDEWLEHAAGSSPAPQPDPTAFVTVKPLEDILRTLDARGRRDGVLFDPAMARYAGRRLPLYGPVAHRVTAWWRRPLTRWYIIAGARCDGSILGASGPCDRGCSFLWHRDWLDFATGAGIARVRRG